MKLFKNMSQIESDNWNKSAVLGFYTYMLLLFIDQTYNLLFASNLFSSSVIFWAGLIVAFGTDFILNLTTKRK
ncbi:hypothetical protein CUC15_13960 [Oceanobacillus zhaokaii]|uniref:Uncharacterized protein n=1 Tax=Oceanobacillus zhaokaii TaxID=2052660 RepID=A0A345PIY1_9BACI|nr:hypothetical protein [Oceanobacillus zhaokaii]AXI09961.1 hypothetical protein CUC15_13960 [Oceanobacillus zhaokaii]